MPTPEQNKATYERFCHEVIVRGNLNAIDELLQHDVLTHSPFPGQAPGRAGFKQAFGVFCAAFSDRQLAIRDLIAEDNKVVGYFSVSGTHSGEFMGISATGQRISYDEMVIVRFADGKIAEHWSVADMSAAQQALNAGPVPAAAEPAATSTATASPAPTTQRYGTPGSSNEHTPAGAERTDAAASHEPEPRQGAAAAPTDVLPGGANAGAVAPETQRQLVQEFFVRYADHFNRSLQGEKVDPNTVAESFAKHFVEASPHGVNAAKNGRLFRWMIPRGFEHYRKLGTTRMNISDLDVESLDALHALAKVHWESHYEKRDGSQDHIEFDVTYLLHFEAGDPKIFAYITGDEEGMLREHGLA